MPSQESASRETDRRQIHAQRDELATLKRQMQQQQEAMELQQRRAIEEQERSALEAQQPLERARQQQSAVRQVAENGAAKVNALGNRRSMSAPQELRSDLCDLHQVLFQNKAIHRV